MVRFFVFGCGLDVYGMVDVGMVTVKYIRAGDVCWMLDMEDGLM